MMEHMSRKPVPIPPRPKGGPELRPLSFKGFFGEGSDAGKDDADNLEHVVLEVDNKSSTSTMVGSSYPEKEFSVDSLERSAYLSYVGNGSPLHGETEDRKRPSRLESPDAEITPPALSPDPDSQILTWKSFVEGLERDLKSDCSGQEPQDEELSILPSTLLRVPPSAFSPDSASPATKFGRLRRLLSSRDSAGRRSSDCWRNRPDSKATSHSKTTGFPSRPTPNKSMQAVRIPARHALEIMNSPRNSPAVRTFSNAVTSATQLSLWKAVEDRFDLVASEDGMLSRDDFAACIGMNDSKVFAEELLDALSRRKETQKKKAKISKDELYEYWRRITDTSFDSRMQLFFDLCDKDSGGCISEDEVKEVILLCASANNLSILDEQAEEYAALIMEEFDSDHKGYIELSELEVLMRPSVSITGAPQNFNPVTPCLRTRWQRHSQNIMLYLRDDWQQISIIALWVTANLALFGWKFVQFLQHYAFGIMEYCVSTTEGAAETLKLNMALILLPACRYTITWLRSRFYRSSIPFNDNNHFHKLIASGIVLGVILHVVPMLTCNFPLLAESDCLVHFTSVGHSGTYKGMQLGYFDYLMSTETITGFAMVLFMSMAFFLASECRRKSMVKLPFPFQNLTGFNAFWYSHHMFVIVYVLLFVHGWYLLLTNKSFQKTTWMYLLVPIVLYCGERTLRAFRASKYKVSTFNAAIYPGNVFALYMTKPDGFSYISGMYIFIQCPSISKFEWHPFSLTSAPGDEHLSVHARAVDAWTTAFREVFQEALSAGTNDAFPKLIIDGPHGAPGQDFHKYDILLLVGLGIGATPYISILKDVLNNIKHRENFQQEDPAPSAFDAMDTFGRYLFASNIRDVLKYGGRKSASKRTGDNNPKSKARKTHGPTTAYFYWVTREQGSFEWFNDVTNEVAEIDGKAEIELHNYLTSVYQEGDARSALITMVEALHHAKSGVDIVSGTRAHTHYAYPNWPKVFSKLSVEHPDSTIGVFYCGVPTGARELKALSRKYTRESSTKFEFHEEHF